MEWIVTYPNRYARSSYAAGQRLFNFGCGEAIRRAVLGFTPNPINFVLAQDD